MSTLKDRIATGGNFYTAAPAAPKELFPSSLQHVFNRLKSFQTDDSLYEAGEVRPSQETIAWAATVLLGVLPSYFLRTAEIDTHHGEIHVSWERGTRRVVAFLPSPKILKIYAEWEDAEGETRHLLRPSDNPRVLNDFLQWLYS
jgi:transcriptional regulator with XRE-family HTH domain